MTLAETVNNDVRVVAVRVVAVRVVAARVVHVRVAVVENALLHDEATVHHLLVVETTPLARMIDAVTEIVIGATGTETTMTADALAAQSTVIVTGKTETAETTTVMPVPMETTEKVRFRSHPAKILS